MRWRALLPVPSHRAISDATPGTTCGNHRANFPRHLRTSPGMVFAVQLYELTPRAGTRSLPLFALQARGHWFEPSCAHQVLQLDGLFETLIGDPVTTGGNHRCMLPDGRRVPRAGAASSSITRARPTSTAGTAGVAGAAGAASSARASDLTQAQAVQGQRPDQAGRHRGAEEEERGN